MSVNKTSSFEHTGNLRNGCATSPVSMSDNITSSTLNSTPSPTLEEPPPSAPAPPPPPPPPCPPPPPMAPLSPGDQKLPPPVPIPPPPAGMMQAPDGAMTIKRKVRFSCVTIKTSFNFNFNDKSVLTQNLISFSGSNEIQTAHTELDRSETESSTRYYFQRAGRRPIAQLHRLLWFRRTI